ncbi:MAG: hypothetical protein IPO21_16335 [Bacteroidales bacterium]|nr:hypothetical protein [Bacteroidales bacterium]
MYNRKIKSYGLFLFNAFLFSSFCLSLSAQSNLDSLQKRFDNAYYCGLYKKTFDIFSDHYDFFKNDTLRIENAALSGLYCLRYNMANDRIAENTPLYFDLLNNLQNQNNFVKNEAETYYYVGVYLKDEMPTVAFHNLIKSMETIDKAISQKNNEDELLRIKNNAEEAYLSIIEKYIFQSAYNVLINDLAAIARNKQYLSDSLNSKLRMKLQILDSYVEFYNDLVFVGKNHFVNETLKEIQAIISNIEDVSVSKQIDKLSYFIMQDFRKSQELHDFKINQAKAIKAIAEERNNLTPDENQKMEYWREHLQRETDEKKQKLIKDFGIEMVNAYFTSEQTNIVTIDFCKKVEPEILKKELFTFSWVKYELWILKNKQYLLFKDNKLYMRSKYFY